MNLRLLPRLFLLTCLLPLSGSGHYLNSVQHSASGDSIGYVRAPVRRTGIRFPRLSRYRNRVIMRQVNSRIDELTSEFGCEDPGKNTSFRVRSAVEYAEHDIFSIYATAEYYCGTAYPTNDANYSITFDLRTGKEVKFGELFEDYDNDSEEILKLIFAEQISRNKQVAASGQAKENTCDGDPEMYSMNHLNGTTFAFNFSKNGLRVQPEWPHVIESCAELVTVPYQSLKKFARPHGLLARVMK